MRRHAIVITAVACFIGPSPFKVVASDVYIPSRKKKNASEFGGTASAAGAIRTTPEFPNEP
jgi:hypothetical protein